MWTKHRVCVSTTDMDPMRRRVLGGGLLLFALPWLALRNPVSSGGSPETSAMDAGDGFVVIDGWVVPDGYFRE